MELKIDRQNRDYWYGAINRNYDEVSSVYGRSEMYQVCYKLIVNRIEEEIGSFSNLIQIYGVVGVHKKKRVQFIYFKNDYVDCGTLEEGNTLYDDVYYKLVKEAKIRNCIFAKGENESISEILNDTLWILCCNIKDICHIFNKDVFGIEKKLSFYVRFEKYKKREKRQITEKMFLKEMNRLLFDNSEEHTAVTELDTLLYSPKILDIWSVSGYKNIFDFVEVEFKMLSNKPKEKRIDILKRNKGRLIRECFRLLESKYKYYKFGVPVEYLKLIKLRITSQTTLVCLFELKQIEGVDKETGFLKDKSRKELEKGD